MKGGTGLARCPGCGSPMQPEGHGPIDIDRCPSCGDLWFDHTELVTYCTLYHPGRLEWDRRPPPRTTSDGLDCPHCMSASLRFHEFAGLQVNRCDLCSGFHISRGEFERVQSKVGERLRGPDADRPDDGKGFVVEVLSEIIEIVLHIGT
jgi:Zn-finger nucleic acid-binding protein